MKKINTFIILAFSLLSFNLLAAPDCKTISFGDMQILCLKKGLGMMNVEERALLIEKRLNHLAKDLTLDPHEISIIPEEGMLNVNLKDYYIMSLRDGDFDYPANQKFEDASKDIVNSIKSGILTQREIDGPERLIKGAIYTLIATLIFVFVLFSFSKLFPKLYKVITDVGQNLPSFKIQNWEVLSSARVVQFIVWLAHVLRTVLTLLAIYIYIPLILSFFPKTAPMAPYIFNFIGDPLKLLLNAFLGFIPNLFFILVMVVVANYTLNLIRFFFDEIEKGNIEFQGFYKDWAMPSYTLIRVLVIAVSLVIIFPYIPGSESSAFKGVSVFFGLLLSLGSSSSIANIVAGIVITYMRPFKIGDLVKINDTVGKVFERNLLVTRLRTNKNVDVTVPNSMILGTHISNYSNHADTEGLILNVDVAFGYEINWNIIHKLMTEAALKTPEILQNPAPFVWHKSLDDFYVTYELNAFVKNVSSLGQIKSDLHRNIQDIFFENGIEMVAPIYNALMDGSETCLPKEYRKSDYQVPRLRFKD